MRLVKVVTTSKKESRQKKGGSTGGEKGEKSAFTSWDTMCKSPKTLNRGGNRNDRKAWSIL